MSTNARTQGARQFAVGTPLGDDVLLFHTMTYAEELGRPFSCHLELLSEKDTVVAEDLLGQSLTVRALAANDSVRYFSGLVSRFRQLPGRDGLSRYSVELVPWLWFLTRTSDCRIFQEMSVPDIIKQVFREFGFTDFRDAMSGSYRTWEYCVQYRETAFNFVSRLMEQEGIHYYFEHEDGKHTLVLADDIGSYGTFPEYDTLEYHPDDATMRDREFVTSFDMEHRVQPGSYAHTDYDFKRPSTDLRAKIDQSADHPGGDLEIFDYPGEYTEVSDGEQYSAMRLQEFHAKRRIATGVSDARGVAAGRIYSLVGHTRDSLNADYLVTSCSVQAVQDSYQSGGGGGGDAFTCSFGAIPADQPFRTPRTTAKPLVHGPQTAVVVGKDGEEITADEHGRVKVMFHWDRYATGDQTSSCWVRVAQHWAGKGWGTMFVPRHGHEVIVEFLEGDPDRPIITGRVYNGANRAPYDPKTMGTLSTIKTNSSKGGEGFNELRFEDKKGSEQVFLHGEKNLDVRVKNNRYETIGNDRHLVVENDKWEHVKNDRDEIVDRDHIEHIKRDMHLTIDGKRAVKITGVTSLIVDDDVVEEFNANHSTVVADDAYVKATNVVIEASDNVTIKVGDSFVAIESGGVKIGTSGDIVFEAGGAIEATSSGNTVVNAGVDLELNSTANTTISAGAMGEFASSAPLTLSGAMVNIN
ncbi:MAG: type VI secretion system tip protein VgrG [Phycisphaerae bacterium]|nr:type VI secretion system tip protein VgrG [Phycisphaerae bacterium]